MKIWLATSNSGKINELKHLLSNLPVSLHSPKELNSYYYPKETGSSFKDNALIKAKALHSVCPEDWVIADDSGLEVKALNNLPGVHSARYAGEHASDAENISKVIKMLSFKPSADRSARFICSLVAISPQGKSFHFEGEVKGNISKLQKGTQGFGYDPIFIPNGEEKTFSELSPSIKNKISHRKQALQQFIDQFKKEIL